MEEEVDMAEVLHKAKEEATRMVLIFRMVHSLETIEEEVVLVVEMAILSNLVNIGKCVLYANSIVVICQICFKPRQTAAECRNRFNRDFVPSYPLSSNNLYQYLAPRLAYQNSAPRAAFLVASKGDVADQG